MGKKVLIIGGVAGGASTAARLRRLDESLEIIIFDRGDYISYANCGLPYYIGDVIKQRDDLIIQTPQGMKKKFNIDVRINNEVMAINRDEKSVTVKNLKTNEEYSENYDILVIATGSTPRKPSIPGVDEPGIHTLWTINDTDKIKSLIEDKKPKRAVVIGGGFIGVEMIENLHSVGCEVSLIEVHNQVMRHADFELAQLLHKNMRENGVKLYFGQGINSFKYDNGVTTIELSNGKTIETDIVILSTGVTPNSSIAKDAGLEVNERGGIAVDSFLKTNDEYIYAVGDVIQVEEFVLKAKTMIPLAGPANKQGRICANNIYYQLNGIDILEEYKGTQGTSVAKVFDLTLAMTGFSESALVRLGKEPNKDYFVALINQKSHSGYYPGAKPITLKLVFAPDGKIFGAQAVGMEGVDKRIDVIATTQRLGGTIYDLCELELAYAPPYSSAKDPVNMAGFVAENILNGLASFTSWDEINKNLEENPDNQIILDVTEDFEREVFEIPNSYHIPLGQLRNRLNELDKDKLIIPYCAVGVRSYNAARILMNNGFKNVKIYPGGTSLYRAVFPENTEK